MHIIDKTKPAAEQIAFLKTAVLDTAKQMLIDDGELLPTAFFWSPADENNEGGVVIVGIPFDGEDSKDEAAIAVRYIAAETKAEVFALVTDTYMRMLKRPYADWSKDQQMNLYHQVGTMSDEQKSTYFETNEAINIAIQSYVEGHAAVSLIYKRTDDGFEFAEPEEFQMGDVPDETRFQNVLLPRKADG